MAMEDVEQCISTREEQDTWRSCCLIANKSAMIFFSQLLFCLILVTFCISRLVTLKSCEDTSIYISLLTFIIGLILPHPIVN